ncbi:MAG TPA: histidine phosphatase family protein [Pseudonocardiaceae bacterium]|nr:histidine phosphatase family protein [Pseudonocardiaceae bacterium]
MEFVLVRHAEPDTATASCDRADPGLSVRGEAQARALAQHRGLGAIDLIVHSPSRRAVQTAGPVAKRLGLGSTTLPGLAEFDWDTGGDYTSAEDMRAVNDERWRAMLQGNLPDGIDPVVFRARVVAAFAELACANPGRRVLAVTHGGVLNAYTGDIVGLTQTFWIHYGYSSVSRVAVSRNGRRGILALNETGHLWHPDVFDILGGDRAL